MSTVRNFCDAWLAAAKNRDFYNACREQWVWPHQVEGARTPHDLEQLREEWLGQVHPLVTTQLDADEQRRYGQVVEIDRNLPPLVSHDPDIRVAVLSLPPIIKLGRTSSYMFIRTKVNTREENLTVTASRSYSEKPSIVQEDITLGELNLGQLRDILVALR